MKVWEMENTDVVRFVLRRSEWDTLITALAGAAAWAPSDRRNALWDALDVLRNAEEDIDASEMARRLAKIVDLTKQQRNNDEQIIHAWATKQEAKAA